MLNRFNSLFAAVLLLAATAHGAVSTGVRLNSVGFLPNNVKRASVLGAGAVAFNVRRVSDNSSAFSGTLSAAATNADTSESLRIADFSALTETGSFYLDVTGLGTSPNFAIGPDVYNDPFWAEVMGFYSHRCGTAVSYTWKGQTFGHGACHLNDAYQDSIGGGHVIRNGTRGWHDAGDYGKYTINGSFATAMLLQAWEWHKGVISQWSFPIPESGGAIPDYLDEVKWNLDWLRKMQAANGSAYHKLTTYNFAGFVMPEADTGDTQYAPAGSHATADLCGVMAMAARIYQPYDAAFAAQCQATADAAWAWLQANPGEVLPNLAGFGTGAYNEAGPDPARRPLAAAEYWETTGNATALADFESRMAADADKVSTFWDWGEYVYGKRGPKNHGIFTYLLSSRGGRNATRVADLQADLMAEANAMVSARNAHGYGRPLGTEYHWGSNGTVARQVMLLDAADQLAPSAAYQDTMLDALGYVFGRNTYDRSFVTGVGYNPPLNPHDRHSASDGKTDPVPGHLVGGAESTAGDWTDVQGNFTTNEIAINWDAALVAALARFITVPPPATPTPTPSPTPCFSASPFRRVNAGGATVTTGGNTWTADQAYSAGGWGYTGGSVSTNTSAISGTTDDVLYQSGRYGMSQYQFTVANGSYRVEIHFAETYWNANGNRVMSVTLEGQPAITNLDIYATVGGEAALVLQRDVTVSDGILTIGFSASIDSPEIRAIALYSSVACPSTPTFTPSPNWTATPTPTRTSSFSPSPTRTVSATITPTPSTTPTACGTVVAARIHAGGTAFTDGSGNAWAADNSYTGGTAASVSNAISGTTDDALYQTERYGSPLAYAIAVPYTGSYQVRFLWAETFHTGTGDRVFSVTLEGAAAISNLDLFAVAGANAAYQLTRTVSVSDGVLNIGATASVDQAKFDAIEVIYLGSPCASPTQSPSFTASRTPSASSTATPTRSPSATPSATPTASGTRTATSSATPSSTASASPTDSPSPSATPSASPSATPSATRSATGTGTPSATLTGTRTPSFTVSPTPVPGSPTATPSFSVSPSQSPTRSASPTASPSSSPSVTQTASGTATPSASPSATRSASPTFTASLTATQTSLNTATHTPTQTRSFTGTQTVTLSATPSITATVTASASPTVTPTRTSSTTPTASPTATRTASPTLTASPTPSASPSISPTFSPVPTGSTETDTPTISPTGTATPSVTLSETPTLTETLSASPSATLSASPTLSPMDTATLSPTPSPANTVTVTPSLTPTATQPSGPPPTASLTATPGPTAPPYGQDLKIEALACLPNPLTGPTATIRFRLSGPADTLRLRLYSRAFVCVGVQESHGSYAPGWNSATLDMDEMAAGPYFLRAEAQQQGLRSLPAAPLRIVRLR